MIRHTFAVNGLDRCHGSRSNPVFVRTQLERPDALIVPFLRLKPLLRDADAGSSSSQSISWISLQQLREKLPMLKLSSIDESLDDTVLSDWVFLGMNNQERPLFAVDISIPVPQLF